MKRFFGRRGEGKEGDEKENEDGYAEDAQLVSDLARFCLANDSLDRWKAFMERHEAAFDCGEGKQSDEHKLEHTSIHADFVALVEDSLGDWLSRRDHVQGL